MASFGLPPNPRDPGEERDEDETAETPPRIRFADEEVVYCASFTLSAAQAALDAVQRRGTTAAVDRPSETRHAHPYAIAERLKVQSDIAKTRKGLLQPDEARKGDEESEDLRVVSVPTLLPGLLDDSQYMEEAKIAYERIVRMFPDDTKKYVFMEEVPDISPL
ncbi:unnamed protein product [Phytomonas sp. Hart1]|nr:unnamed protein product [Phytomonas sp. Hart1]|eukprot:CCW67776.1 unnamed protein product [Phytomonas sp. isolate Hart1]